MDPHTYCEQAMAELSSKPTRRGALERPQLLVVLAHFIRHELSDRAFARELRDLAESADRRGRLGLAAAARAVLRDWETRRAAGSSAANTGQ